MPRIIFRWTPKFRICGFGIAFAIVR